MSLILGVIVSLAANSAETGNNGRQVQKMKRKPASLILLLKEVGHLEKQAKSLAGRGDDLGLRIIVKRASLGNLTYAQWHFFRALIHHRPGVGWDLIRGWDRLPSAGVATPLQVQIEDLITRADSAMTQKQFSGAASAYSEALKILKRANISFGSDNFFLYQSISHSLARALYGQGQYTQALEVYQWISLNYPFFRQVQFEKMWAAFRAENYSLTLGAIASQMSSYYSSYLEPESYLVQYYLYRRLCRTADVTQVERAVANYKKLVLEGNLKLENWARHDNETMILSRLIDLNRSANDTSEIPRSQRLKEVQFIRQTLETRFRVDITRIREQMEKVAAYMNLARDAQKTDLPPIVKVPTYLSSKTEMWPVEDAEDWLDEIGHHIFIGESQCAK